MFHTIQFTSAWVADLEISPKHRLERLRVRKGMKACANVVSYVIDSDDGLIEVADLYFDDGTVTRRVRFGQFRFVDE